MVEALAEWADEDDGKAFGLRHFVRRWFRWFDHIVTQCEREPVDRLLESVQSTMRRLLLELRGLEVTRSARVSHDAHISRAVEFLRRSQNPDGSWGMGALIDTTMALRALGLWAPSIRDWSLASGAPGGVDLAFKWLDENQIGGAWENNIWDTSAVIRGAALHQELHRPSVVRAVAWIEQQECTSWGLNDGLPPHYASQALLALLESHSSTDLTVLRERLYEVVVNQPDLPSRSLYIAGQVLEALICAGENPADAKIRAFTEVLDSALQTHEVSIANFLDICAGFLGLGQAYGAVDSSTDAMQQTLSKLLNPNRLRSDGSWYRDLTLSAWALVSLSTIQTVRIVEGFPVIVYGAVADASEAIRQAVEHELRVRRQLVYLAFALGATGLSLLASLFIQLWGGPALPHDTNAGWGVVSVLTSTTLYLGRIIWIRINE